MYHIYSYLVIHKNSGASRLRGFENSVNLLWHNVAHTHTHTHFWEVRKSTPENQSNSEIKTSVEAGMTPVSHNRACGKQHTSA